MNRGELFRALDEVDAALTTAKIENDHVFMLEKIFPTTECDYELADEWLNGDFEAVRTVLFRELKDERLCGRLVWRSLTHAISSGILAEYRERGHQTLPNGMVLTDRNVLKMLQKTDN